jgi:hypothetical protein
MCAPRPVLCPLPFAATTPEPASGALSSGALGSGALTSGALTSEALTSGALTSGAPPSGAMGSKPTSPFPSVRARITLGGCGCMLLLDVVLLCVARPVAVRAVLCAACCAA